MDGVPAGQGTDDVCSLNLAANGVVLAASAGAATELLVRSASVSPSRRLRIGPL
jgi:hypothetical protein